MYEVITRKTIAYPSGEPTVTISFEAFNDDWKELNSLPCWSEVEKYLKEKRKHVEVRVVTIREYGPKCNPCEVDEIRERDKKLKILALVSLGASISLVILALVLKLLGM